MQRLYGLLLVRSYALTLLPSSNVLTYRRFALVLLVVMPVLALVPAAQLVAEWVQLAQMMETPLADASPRGFDGVMWDDSEGLPVARYVFPEGPASEAGVQEGDALYTLAFQQFFTAEDLSSVIESIPPGRALTYTLLRGDDFVEADVRVAAYPTFLYPLSQPLWLFTRWGFAAAAFLHVLALIVVVPLARRSRAGLYTLALIAASALWILANAARILLLDLFGAPLPETRFAQLFTTLTVLGLAGWAAFPALLLRKVLDDGLGDRLPRWYLVAYAPKLLLGGAVVWAAATGGIGPVPLGALIGPTLFYVSCYVAGAAALALALYRTEGARARGARLRGGLGPVGSVLTFLFAVTAALSVVGVLPLLGAATQAEVGWIVVGVQLLSLVPVLLVSTSTLRHGKLDVVLARALASLAALGLFFFLFVAGLTLAEGLLERAGIGYPVAAGLYGVLLLVLFERVFRRFRDVASTLVASQRDATRRRLRRFAATLPGIASLDVLAREAATATGEAFQPRSAVVFLRLHDDAGLTGSSYRPEPPYFTEHHARRVWDALHDARALWAHNPELSEATLTPAADAVLREAGAALALPVRGESGPAGIVVLGPSRTRTVYNLEDVELVRALAAQLALATERLRLIERERALARESAEAQLVALRAQINPHFLFNALNTIIARIDEAPEEAEATVERLAAIFRYVLQTGSEDFVPLRDELRLVDHYLAVEQARFGEKLEVERAIQEDVLARQVPAFVVQTLVENAVKHGIERRRGGGQIRLAARMDDDDALIVEVADTGAGLPALYGRGRTAVTGEDFLGIGLRNVAERLRQLYSRDDLLTMESEPEQGTRAWLRLPE